MTNSHIAEVTSKKEIVSASNQETHEDEDNKALSKRDMNQEHSRPSQVSKSLQKKLIFQRMIELNGSNQAKQTERHIVQRKTHDSNTQVVYDKARPASVRAGETENKLFKTLLDSNTETSPSNQETISQGTQAIIGVASKEGQDRSSSAQPAMRIKSLWRTRETKPEEESQFEPEDYVKKWIDHSAKYGLVSIMHSGLICILFNDMSKAIFRLKVDKFVYLSRSQGNQREEARVFALGFPPRDLEKKVGIIKDICSTLGSYEKDLNLSSTDSTFIMSSKVISSLT